MTMMTLHDSPVAPPEAAAPLPSGVLNSTVRFTLDGSDALENHLDRICQRVLAGVLEIVPEKSLEAVLLGGSYGRGEGGVWWTTTGDRPYNDLEFYVALRGVDWLNERCYREPLHELGRKLSPDAGVEVEFKVFSLSKLRRRPVSMFSYDLVMGHRWLWGREALFKGCEQHRDAGKIPLSEVTRLLMNRCSGLLFAKEFLQHGILAPAETDFVVRNLAKAKLALGDALLTVYGQYHWSCRERHARLTRLTPNKDLPWLETVQGHYHEGASFKLHPQRRNVACEELLAEHTELAALALQVWLWLERRRLNTPFNSAFDYAFSPVDKCPETSHLRNRLVNTWHFGPEMTFAPAAARHPYERLFHSVALLLWEPSSVSNPRVLHRLQADLETGVSTFTGLVGAYRTLWARFN